MAVCRIMVCVCLIKLEVGIWSPGEAEISLKCAHAVCVAKLSTEPNNNRHWSVDVLFKSCSLSIDCRTNPHTQRPQAHELLKPLTTKSLYPASRSLYPPKPTCPDLPPFVVSWRRWCRKGCCCCRAGTFSSRVGGFGIRESLEYRLTARRQQDSNGHVKIMAEQPSLT